MDRKLVTVLAAAFLTALGFAAGAGAAPKGGKGTASGDASKLMGSWECQGQGATAALVFKTRDTLIYQGEAAGYALVPGAVRVLDAGGGYIDYKYKLSGNSLSVAAPDGSSLQCKRGSQASSQARKALDGAPSVSVEGIRGTFCSWSGSSGAVASYSSSGRASFDGKGHFSFGSESSFSSKEGMAYGQSAGAGNDGTYTVSGNDIQIKVRDGSVINARVHFRLADGSVSEIMYGETLYGKALCE